MKNIKRGENQQLEISFEKMKNGNVEGFHEIYKDLKTPVFTVVFRIVKDYHLAEELTQEIFVKLYRFHQLPSGVNLRAYVFQMAHNLSIDALRKRNTNVCGSIDEVNASTDGGFESFVFGLDIENALSRLEDDEREIVSLHLNGGLTFEEISEIMKLSISAVYRKYSKSIKALKKQLSGGYE